MTNVNHSSNVAPRPGNSPDGSELVTQMDRSVHGMNEEAPEQVDAHIAERRDRPPGLPIWLAEKFHWVQRDQGKPYLDPNPEYLDALYKDSAKFVEYGYGRCLINGEGARMDSTESAAVDSLSTAYLEIRETLGALDESSREVRALTKGILERITSNAISAASTQFEIDNWAARSAQSNKDASDHPGFADKLARRDEFAQNAAVWMAVYRNVFPDIAIATDAYVKAAKQTVYQQARIRGSELLAPTAPEAGQQHARAAAVLASRPFA